VEAETTYNQRVIPAERRTLQINLISGAVSHVESNNLSSFSFPPRNSRISQSPRRIVLRWAISG
jgi:hypothetical protein